MLPPPRISTAYGTDIREYARYEADFDPLCAEQNHTGIGRHLSASEDSSAEAFVKSDEHTLLANGPGHQCLIGSTRHFLGHRYNRMTGCAQRGDG